MMVLGTQNDEDLPHCLSDCVLAYKHNLNLKRVASLDLVIFS